ncbi:MAG: DUF3332 family protein [Bdellovibrio sp.]
MQTFWKKLLFYVSSLIACSMMALNTGCASGGYKLTREYAGWVNKQNLILRIILYILTMVVFAVTLLIDTVIFNTMDFWDGKVSAGDFEFKDGSKTYHVKHEFLPSNLRRSTIDIKDGNAKVIQNIVMLETPAAEIELYVDGKLRTRVKNIADFPIASMFNEHGQVIEEKAVLFSPSIAIAK